MNVPQYSLEEPTALLRFNKGMLEQAWKIVEHSESGVPIRMLTEWRKVPEVIKNE